MAMADIMRSMAPHKFKGRHYDAREGAQRTSSRGCNVVASCRFLLGKAIFAIIHLHLGHA